jgi:Uma2 family endonuclease
MIRVGLRRLTRGKNHAEKQFFLAIHSTATKITLMRQRDMQYHTYADYLVWSATSGNELIDGVAYVREPPSPSWLHQEIVVELCRQITNSLRGKPERACVAPLDVRLPKNGAADDPIDTVVQPDVFIVRDLKKLDDRGMCGAPDWVAEVLSPSTARYDRITKLAAYKRAGVPEIWLIDPTDRTVAIYRLAASHYSRPAVLDLIGRTAITAVPGVSIDWDPVVAALSPTLPS